MALRDADYWEDKAYAPVAAVGLIAVMAALAVAIALGFYVGDIFADLGDPENQTRQGVVGAFDKWVRPLMFLGASLLMTAVVIVLRRIRKTLLFEQREAFISSLPVLLSRERS